MPDGKSADGESSQTGLYGKYEVYEDGERVEDCFVLEPSEDHVAAAALSVYAVLTDDLDLKDDITDWLQEIQENE